MISENHQILIDGYRAILKQNKEVDSDLVIMSIIEQTIKLLTTEHINENTLDSDVFSVFDKQYMRVLETHQSELSDRGMSAIVR